MTKEMIISSNGHETMVAILEDDLVAEIFVERERQRGVVGNVYKGRVSKVLPGMQSSFIDLGLERDGFLYVADVLALGRRSRVGRRGRIRGAVDAKSAPAQDRGPAPRGPGDSRAGRQGAARHQRRAPHLARDDGRDGFSCSCRRWITSACRGRSSRARSGAGCARSSASSARRAASPAASSSAPPPPAAPRKTSSAISSRSTRSGPRCGSAPSRRARRPSSTASRAWSASCSGIS